MDISATVDLFRSLEAGGFGDECVIAEPPPETFNTSSGTYTPTPGAEVYAGPCRAHDEGGADTDTGATEVVVRKVMVAVPWDVEPKVNQRLTLTTSKDPALIGVEMTIVGVEADSWVVVRHLECEHTAVESNEEVTDAS